MAGKKEFALEAKRLSLAWWFGRGRNIFWVSVIAILIWVYADLEVSENRQFTVTLRLSTSTQMKLLSEANIPVEFTAKASRRTLAQFQQWLKEHNDVIEFDLSDYEPGEYNEPTDKLLNRAPDIEDWGLTVQRTITPAAIPIWLDSVATRELPVELDAAGGVIADQALTPQLVKVTAATSVWKAADEMGIEPVIRTERQDLSQIPAGQSKTFTARLIAALDGHRVSLDPESVSVALTVSQRTDTRTISVDVTRMEPVAWAAENVWVEYEFVRNPQSDWRVEIVVTGPKKDLDQLQGADVRAFVELTEDDKRPVESWLDRPIKVHLPDGLQLRLVGDPPTVQFKLVQRTERLPG
jgi:hypothetical protein